MRTLDNAHEVPTPTTEDIRRIEILLREIGGPHVSWGAQQKLDVWVIEQRAKADRLAADRLRRSSWALVVATVGLVLCTAGLIWATFAA
jgi:dissimilatory sulfite reductase (desulfoviridin) alpha/beta subunit